MFKLTLEIKETKDESCQVTTKVPKDLSKATEIEKQCAYVVKNKIEETLAKMK